MLLVRHGEAIEADLLEHGIDVLDFWRGRLSLRRLAVLVEHWCLRRGTALAYSLHGERGRWLTSDEILASAYGVKGPEDKRVTEWKRVNQERIARMRAERAAQLAK